MAAVDDLRALFEPDTTPAARKPRRSAADSLRALVEGGAPKAAPPRGSAADGLRALFEASATDSGARAATATPAARASVVQGEQAAAQARGRTPQDFRLAQAVNRLSAELDPQRRATVLERALDTLQAPVYAGAGLLAEGVAGHGPHGSRLSPGGAIARGMREGVTYGDVIREALPAGSRLPVPTPLGPREFPIEQLAPPVGFAADVALNPITYAGAGGVTRAGRAAKAAAVEGKLAALSGDAGRMAAAAQMPGNAALAAGVRPGERALLNFGSAEIGRVPDEAYRLAEMLRGSPVGKLFDPTPELSGIDRTVFRAREAQIGGEQALRMAEADRYLGRPMRDLRRKAGALGLKADDVERALADAVERGAAPTGDNLLPFMTAAERRKYEGWQMEATRRANPASPEYVTAGAGGRPLEVLPGGRTPDGKTVITGPAPNAGAMVGPLHDPKAASFLGAAPAQDDIASFLPENTVRAMRRFEAAAAKRARRFYSDRAVAEAANATSPELASGISSVTHRVNRMNARNLAQTKRAGVPLREVEGIGYMRHAARPEARDIIEQYGPKQFKGIGREITERHGAQMKRAFRHPDGRPMTVNEINDLAEAGKLAITGYRPVPGGLFERNPAVATAIRNREAGKAVASAKMLTDFARVYGKPAAQAPKGWQAVPNEVAGVGKDVVFAPDVAAALARTQGRIADPQRVLRAYDKLLSGWKRITLSPFVNYHVRNEIDDLFRATMYGDMDVERMADAVRVLGRREKNAGKPRGTIKLGARTYQIDEVRDLAMKHRAMDSGIVGEMREQMGSLTSRSKQSLTDNAVTRRGQEVGGFRENMTRLSMFMDRLAKGDTPEAAAALTRKIMVDYGDLSSFEQDFMRRLFPFVAYTRKNLPLQAEMLAKKPGVAAGVQAARNAAATDEHGLGAGDAPLPEFLERGLPLRWGTTPEGNPTFARLSGQLGLADLNLADPREMSQRAVELLSPFLSTPFEMASNVDLYRSDLAAGKLQRLEDYPGQTHNLLGAPVSSRWAAPPLDLLRFVNEIDRANPGSVFGTQDEGPAWNPELTRRFAQPTEAERLANMLVGRSYGVDPLRERDAMWSRQEREIRRLEQVLDRATRQSERDRINDRIDYLKAHPEATPR